LEFGSIVIFASKRFALLLLIELTAIKNGSPVLTDSTRRKGSSVDTKSSELTFPWIYSLPKAAGPERLLTHPLTVLEPAQGVWRGHPKRK
jgi:hypothetical protein